MERSGILSASTWLWSSSAHVGASTPTEQNIYRPSPYPLGDVPIIPITLSASLHSGPLSSSTGSSNLRSRWHSEEFKEEVHTWNIMYKCLMAHLCNPMAPTLFTHIRQDGDRTSIEVWSVFGNRGASAPHSASHAGTQETAVGVYRPILPAIHD